jgi:outer membrane receptor protein involved in Fe transport
MEGMMMGYSSKRCLSVRLLCTTALLGGAATPFAALAQQSAPATAQPVAAQPADADRATKLEDIVVTARKTTETLMRVPVAASAISGAQMQRYGAVDLSTVGNLVPAVTFERTLGSGSGALTIRGIGSSGTDSGIEQTVSTVLDGVQTSRGQFIQQGVFDLEQIEVLKGPQSLFFGKNSPGGVLSLRSNGPTDEFHVYGRTGYEFNAHEATVEGAVSGPLTDTLRARIAFLANDMRGWNHNDVRSVPNPFATVPGQVAILPGRPWKYNSYKSIAGRATLDWKPIDDFKATLRLFGSANEGQGNTASSEMTHCTTPPHATILGVTDPFQDCKINNHTANADLPKEYAVNDPYMRADPFDRYKSYLGSLTLDYSSGPLAFTSVTGYVGYRFSYNDSCSISTFPWAWCSPVERFHQFSQEARVTSSFDGPINLTAGLYYESSHLDSNQSTMLLPLPPDPATGRYASWQTRFVTSGKAYSAFGQVRWNLLENVELAGGVRYTLEKRKGLLGNAYVNAFLPLPMADAGDFARERLSNSNFSPEITLSWHPVRNSTIYAAYKTGYKSGGFSSSTLITKNIIADSDFSYRPERAKGGEIGFKAQLFDNRVRLTGSVYNFKYRDLQISNFNGVKFEQDTLNVGGARTKGVEAELAWQAMEGLTFNAGIGYTRARYTSFPGIACYGGQTEATGCITDPETGEQTQDLSGQQRVRAPDWSGNVGFNYETPAFSNLVLGLSGSMRFSSKYFTQENNSPFAVQKAYQIYDASVRLRTEDNRWQLALIGRNLGDKQYAVASLDNADSGPSEIGSAISRPRQITLEVTFRY